MKKSVLRSVGTTVLWLALITLGAGTSAAFAGQSESSLIVHVVNPEATDPAIDQALENHYAWIDPTAPTNNGLFVYMPGTGDVPGNAVLVQQEAARLGYHVIGLMYVDFTQIQALCVSQPDPSTCSYDARLEII